MKTTFLLLLCVSLVSSDCPLNVYPRRSVQGFVEAIFDNNPDLHNSPQDFIHTHGDYLEPVKLNVAIGIHGLELDSHEHLDFGIEDEASTTSSLTFRAQVNDSQWGWRRLRFNFFASSQETIFQSNSFWSNQFSAGFEEGKYSLYKSIPNTQIFNGTPIVRVFISGVVAQAKPLSEDVEYQDMLQQYQTFKTFSTNAQLILYFEQALEDKKSLQLKIHNEKIIQNVQNFLSFSIQTNTQLASLKYSYILFSADVLTQKHNYIMGSIAILNAEAHQISVLNRMGMLFTGLNQFHIPRDTNYKAQLSFDNYFGQGSFSSLTNIPYLPIGFSYMAFEMKQLFVCEDCPNSNKIYESIYCVEECPRGFSTSERLGNFYCDICSVEKLMVVDSNTGSCVCAYRHYWNSTEETCKPCPYDCMSCQRADECLTCDNALMQTARTLNISKRCSCPLTGYFDNAVAQNIVCQTCDSSCLTCYGPNPHDCLSCQLGKQVNSQGFCVCSNNFVEVAPGVCDCLFPLIISQGWCIDPNEVCGENQVEQFVDLTKKCVCEAGSYQVLNTCVKCPLNSIFDSEKLICDCINNTVLLNGDCVQCQTNKVFDPATNQCICDLGTFETQDGSCVMCPPKMFYQNGQCECIYNYYEESPGVCKRCLQETDGPRCYQSSY